MNQRSFHNIRNIRSLLFFTLVGFIPLSFASGSYSSGAGGDLANQSYNLGKAAFYKKLICSSCPLAQPEPDAAKAAEIIQQLKTQPQVAATLSDREREAVIQFLKRRYRLD